MSVHLRRLAADHQRMMTAFSNHPFINVLSVEGEPPTKYTVVFRLRSMVPSTGPQPTIGEEHRAEIFLPADYPRRSPFCRMISQVFHPNIDPQKICIGDHWSAGQSLPHLVARIGEMLSFQSYNVKSPLNATAAAWAEMNADRLPLQSDDLLPDL